MLFMCCISHDSASFHCCLVVTCSERPDLLALVGDVHSFCYFPMWCPGSGMALDFIVS